jgi:hypothetical protein
MTWHTPQNADTRLSREYLVPFYKKHKIQIIKIVYRPWTIRLIVNPPDYTSKVSRKHYQRQAKGVCKADNKHNLDTPIGAIVLALECADSVWLESSNVRISPRKTLVRFANRPSLEIQIGPMESSTALAPAISFERLLPNLQEYSFNERTVQIFQSEPSFEGLSYRSHQMYFVNEFAQRDDPTLFRCVNSQGYSNVMLPG